MPAFLQMAMPARTQANLFRHSDIACKQLRLDVSHAGGDACHLCEAPVSPPVKEMQLTSGCVVR